MKPQAKPKAAVSRGPMGRDRGTQTSQRLLIKEETLEVQWTHYTGSSALHASPLLFQVLNKIVTKLILKSVRLA